MQYGYGMMRYGRIKDSKNSENKEHENGEMRRKEEEDRWLQREFVCSVMEKN